jgi:hypothetical protein
MFAPEVGARKLLSLRERCRLQAAVRVLLRKD